MPTARIRTASRTGVKNRRRRRRRWRMPRDARESEVTNAKRVDHHRPVGAEVVRVLGFGIRRAAPKRSAMRIAATFPSSMSKTSDFKPALAANWGKRTATLPSARRRHPGGGSPGWDHVLRRSLGGATFGGHLSSTTKDRDIRRWSSVGSGLGPRSATAEALPLAPQGHLADRQSLQ
jgi:hypothetical protein